MNYTNLFKSLFENWRVGASANKVRHVQTHLWFKCYVNQNPYKAKGGLAGLHTGAINGRNQVTPKKLIKE